MLFTSGALRLNRLRKNVALKEAYDMTRSITLGTQGKQGGYKNEQNRGQRITWGPRESLEAKKEEYGDKEFYENNG